MLSWRFFQILACILLAMLIFTGCTQKQAPSPIGDFIVSYSYGGGYDVNAGASLAIYSNGSVVRFPHSFPWADKNGTRQNWQLSKSDMDEFAKLVENADVPSLGTKYNCGDDCPTDLPTEYINFYFKNSGLNKSISMYAPEDLPAGFSKLMERIWLMERVYSQQGIYFSRPFDYSAEHYISGPGLYLGKINNTIKIYSNGSVVYDIYRMDAVQILPYTFHAEANLTWQERLDFLSMMQKIKPNALKPSYAPENSTEGDCPTEMGIEQLTFEFLHTGQKYQIPLGCPQKIPAEIKNITNFIYSIRGKFPN